MIRAFQKYRSQYTEAAPLAVFRICFGLLMLISIARFWLNGWIEKLYIQPNFFFSYEGFEAIKPLGNYTYLLFIIAAISCIGITLGYKYRLSMTLFFLSFTYIELMDKTTYLNHYYFISVLSFLLIFLPANCTFSIDANGSKANSFSSIPRWCIDAVKLLIGMVYFFAGLAKLNSDWLFNAMPLKIWLPAHHNIPLIGKLFSYAETAYVFSWAGALFDLTIVFFLLSRKWRNLAFMAVLLFHLVTGFLFPIGMFPYIMMFSVLIFFDHKVHQKILNWLASVLQLKSFSTGQKNRFVMPKNLESIALGLLSLFFLAQLSFPFRHLMHNDELFWTENGYRFSWRVMLMEKAGYANFKVVDRKAGQQFYIDNSDFLTTFQEKQMATQPDFIIEYANYLKDHFEAQGREKIEIYVESYVALNGRLSRPFINSKVDLTKPNNYETLILPFNDEIKGI